MTKQDLLDLGFIETFVEEGEEVYFLRYDFDNTGLTLITECSDKVEDEYWWSASFQDYPELSYTKREQVEDIIKAINNRNYYE